MGMTPDMAGANVTPVAMGQVTGREVPSWTLPAGWKLGQGDPMRHATILANDEQPPLTVTVIGLPPQPLLPNVNRWEDQLGLPPTPEADLKKIVRHIDVGDVAIDWVDLTSKPQANGKSQARMLAAMIPRGGQTWFFKMFGPPDKVGAQKDNFEKFLRSVTFSVPAAPAGAPAAGGMGAMPPGHPNLPGMGMPAGHPPTTAPAVDLPMASGGTGLSGYKVPAGWQQQQVQPPRVAMFKMGPEGKQAELVVQKWPPAVFADVLSNVNRWRGQIGLEPVADVKGAAPQPIEIGGQKGTLYDMPGPQQRMMVGVLSGNDVWFFKLTGPADVVAEQKPAFEAFLKSVQFSSAGK